MSTDIFTVKNKSVCLPKNNFLSLILQVMIQERKGAYLLVTSVPVAHIYCFFLKDQKLPAPISLLLMMTQLNLSKSLFYLLMIKSLDPLCFCFPYQTMMVCILCENSKLKVLNIFVIDKYKSMCLSIEV